ncbi:unnamed protein product [Rhizopus stolonifer]
MCENYRVKRKYKNVFQFLFTRKTIAHVWNEGIFGVPLYEATESGSTLWGLCVPDPVYLCFLEIFKRGLDTEGLFRLSGAASEVAIVENHINRCCSEERKLIDVSRLDIHILASLVKKYLRELPEPVIPFEFQKQFQSIDLDKNYAMNQLRSAIISLPSYNRQLIQTILIMASHIQDHVDHNKMCPEALATVFAPVCTGFESALGNIPKKKKMLRTIERHIRANKHWTDIWKLMIEQRDLVISILDQQHYVDTSYHQTTEKESRPQITKKGSFFHLPKTHTIRRILSTSTIR